MKLRDTSLPVVVLQMQHHGALGAVRSLGRLGVPMYGVHPTHRPVGSFSKYCRKVFALDLDGYPAEESVDRLRSIASGMRSTPLLIATNDIHRSRRKVSSTQCVHGCNALPGCRSHEAFAQDLLNREARARPIFPRCGLIAIQARDPL